MTRQAASLVLVLVLGGGWPALGGTVYLDFDSFAPAVYPTDFLAADGISDMLIGGSGPGAAGPRILDLTGHTPPSPPNVFIQHATSNDPNLTHSLTFLFSPELTEFSLTRAGSSGSSTPAWSATFMNSSDGFLGSFGESSWKNMPPPLQFTFSAPQGQTIAKMKLESTWRVTTFRNIPVDDFILTQVPEPSSTLLLGFAGAALAVYGWRKRKKRGHH